jgi:hypothetical protein
MNVSVPCSQSACRPRHLALGALVIAVAGLSPGAAGAAAPASDGSAHCSATADLVLKGCRQAADADESIAQARCINLRSASARQDCRAEAQAVHGAAESACFSQRGARGTACGKLGEGRYDPGFDPAQFDADPSHPSNPNPYFPLATGYRWEFRGANEANTLEVVDQTKLDEGVRCLVLRDLVYADGQLAEATDDWVATGKDGSVWYCGEEVKEYEYFKGDHPRRRELVSIGGSFKHGRDGAKSGTLMLAKPTKGQAYREEFSLANAEDIAEVLSTTYSWGDDTELDRDVPRALAEALCSHDCVVTQNYSMLKTTDIERKYYARGIGVFVEVTLGEGLTTQLVSCNVDPRCATLPQP